VFVVFSVSVRFVWAEFHLTGGSGFTLVEERPNVLERHAEFLPAENHTYKFHNWFRMSGQHE